MTEEVLLFEVAGAVARLTLNRPKAMNAMNMALVAELDRRLAQIAVDDAIRVLVVAGTGPAFCAGADLKEVLASQKAEPREADFLDRADATLACLRNFPKPVIAALNGVTMAGGLEMAMCADIVIAAESAVIGDAHANFGVYPGAGGAAVLPRIIPQNVAMYLLLTGKTLSFDHHGAEHLIQTLAVIDVRPGHDERQRDATAVHQQVALAPLFFPDRSGCGRPPLAPMGL